jgi:hypothetical protein
VGLEADDDNVVLLCIRLTFVLLLVVLDAEDMLRLVREDPLLESDFEGVAVLLEEVVTLLKVVVEPTPSMMLLEEEMLIMDRVDRPGLLTSFMLLVVILKLKPLDIVVVGLKPTLTIDDRLDKVPLVGLTKIEDDEAL